MTEGVPVDEPDADGYGVLHGVERLLTHGLDPIAVVEGHLPCWRILKSRVRIWSKKGPQDIKKRTVVLILYLRIGQSIAYADALEVDVHVP